MIVMIILVEIFLFANSLLAQSFLILIILTHFVKLILK